MMKFFAMTFLIYMFLTSLAHSTAQDRGGGNAYEAEFKKIGQALYLDIQKLKMSDEQLGFSLEKFSNALVNVKVKGTDESVQLKNESRMAINVLTKRFILFSNQQWQELDSSQKRLLVLHEYLRFVGIDDSNYSYSSKIILILDRSTKTRIAALKLSIAKVEWGNTGLVVHLSNDQGTLVLYCHAERYRSGKAALGGHWYKLGSQQHIKPIHYSYPNIKSCENEVNILALASLGSHFILVGNDGISLVND
ncbi:MAG: hypothetical protein ACK5V3_13485 [Bdellovibrionales bacterium]